MPGARQNGTHGARVGVSLRGMLGFRLAIRCVGEGMPLSIKPDWPDRFQILMAMDLRFAPRGPWFPVGVIDLTSPQKRVEAPGTSNPGASFVKFAFIVRFQSAGLTVPPKLFITAA